MAPGVTNVFTVQDEQARAMCPPAGREKPGQITERQIQEYFHNGFLVMKNYFSRSELDPCLKAIETLVDDLAERLYREEKITDLRRDLGVYERLSALEDQYPGTVVILHKAGNLPEPLQFLLSNYKLLNLMEQLLGPDVSGHPVWNLRTKAPQSEAGVVPWHQDNAYFGEDVENTLIPTVWIPFLDCDAVHGCLEFMSGGHRSGKLARHVCCAGNTWYVELDEGEAENTLGVDVERDIVRTPINYGDFILFHNAVPHRSLDNFSDKVRWSVDLRYHDPKKPLGMFGLKEGVEMRRGGEDVEIQWDKFNAVDRNQKQIEFTRKDLEEEGFTDLETVISGPWMKRWQIVPHNRHTKSFQRGNLEGM